MSYGNFVLLDEPSKLQKGERVILGEVKGKNETWLRDILFDNSEIIPTDEIDPSYGPLVPLCKELVTDAGRIDAVFINERGLLTIIECKLWKNPQARREVVAQTLDYVSALAGWSYADLSKQVAAAVGGQGDKLFELVRKRVGSGLNERKFAEAVSQSLREGRLLVLIAGDGFREGVQSLTDLVNRTATKAFSFGLIEVALYRFGKNRFAIQPRVLAKTEIIVRHVTIVNVKEGNGPIVIEEATGTTEMRRRKAALGSKAHLRSWWEPILKMGFDDPQQEPPFWLATNNIALNTPFPGIQIKALAIVGKPQIGIFLSGPKAANVTAIQKYLKRDRRSLLNELPNGTEIRIGDAWPIMLLEFDIESDDEKRAWIMKALNTFANVLRPRLKRWFDESRR
jgi:hypothetical protein